MSEKIYCKSYNVFVLALTTNSSDPLLIFNYLLRITWEEIV